MADLPYNEKYLKGIFSQNPDLKKQTDKIIDKLSGSSKGMLLLTKGELEELIESILLTFINSGDRVPKISELTAEDQVKFFKQITEISKLISEKGGIEDEESLLSLVVDNLASSYMNIIQNHATEEPDFLTEKDKKRIKEELERMMQYEIHKKLNPKRLAGETAKENFINNMQVGGAALASQYEGKEYLVKINLSALSDLGDLHNQFRQDFKVEQTSEGQKLSPNVSQTGKYQGRNFSK